MKTTKPNITRMRVCVASVFCLSMILGSCSDETPAPPEEKKEEIQDIPAKSIKRFEYPGVLDATFHYEKGKMSEIVWGGTDTMEVTYDGDYISGFKSPTKVAKVRYNPSTGQIMEYSFNPEPSTHTIFYHYNGSEEQPSGYTWMWKRFVNGSWQDDTLYRIRNLQYNVKGGLTSAEVKSFSANTVLNATFELIDKPNVFSGNAALHVLPQFGDGAYGFTKVSRQFIKSCTLKHKSGQTNTIISFGYAWDSEADELPVLITYTPDSSPTDKLFEWNK